MKKIKGGILGRTVGLTLGALALSMGGCALLAKLVLWETVEWNTAQFLAAVLPGVWLFLACYLAVKPAPQRKLPLALAMAAGYVGVSLLVHLAACSDSPIAIDWRLALPVAGAAVAGLLAKRPPSRNRR